MYDLGTISGRFMGGGEGDHPREDKKNFAVCTPLQVENSFF